MPSPSHEEGMHTPTRLRPLVFMILASLAGCASEHALSCVSDASIAPCPAPLVDEGDACVGWRAIPPPPCTPVALVHVEGSVAVRCDVGIDYALGPSFTWDQVDDTASPITQESDGPADDPISPRLAVTFADGTRVATHGDVYAIPAAWRAAPGGAWRATVSPPSAFLTHGAALSDHDALFVGRDAFVVTILPR